MILGIDETEKEELKKNVKILMLKKRIIIKATSKI